MIFRTDLAEKVMAGEKTVTRRAVSDNPRSPWWREKCGYEVGQRFTVNPGRGVVNIGSAVVTTVRREQVGELLTDVEAQAEGFPTVAAFEAAWREINGDFDPTTLVWRIEFVVVP